MIKKKRMVWGKARELRILRNRMDRLVQVCEETASEVTGEKESLHFIPLKDQKRLMILDTWSRRYKVPVEWIFEVLLLYYGFKDGQWRRRKNTMPVTMVTFVSETSELILQRKIEQSYPGETNLAVWRQQRQEEIMHDMLAGEPKRRQKTMLDFKSQDDFHRWYGDNVDKERRKIAALKAQLRKTRPYRDNPFR